MDFPVEYYYYTPVESSLVIVHQHAATTVNSYFAFLIFDGSKYNAYLLGASDFNLIAYGSAQAIVDNCYPQPLEFAQREFPEFELTAANYHF